MSRQSFMAKFFVELSAGAGATKQYLFITPPIATLPTGVYYQMALYASDDFVVTFYEAPTTTANGTLSTMVVNLDRRIGNGNAMKMYDDPTVTVDGKKLWETRTIPTVTQPNVAQLATYSIILKQNSTKYLLRTVKNSGYKAFVDFNIWWDEYIAE